MVSSASIHIYRCRKVSRHIQTFQLEFALKRREYQKSNCSNFDFKQSLRLSGIFPSRMESRNVVYFLRWTVGLGTNLSEQYLLSILDHYSVLCNRERIK